MTGEKIFNWGATKIEDARSRARDFAQSEDGQSLRSTVAEMADIADEKIHFKRFGRKLGAAAAAVLILSTATDSKDAVVEALALEPLAFADTAAHLGTEVPLTMWVLDKRFGGRKEEPVILEPGLEVSIAPAPQAMGTFSPQEQV